MRARHRGDRRTGHGGALAELRDELFTLLAAGHDTTAITLCWTFFELFSAPDILRALCDEVKDAERGGTLDFAALEQAPLLDAVLRESQRLWPVFPILSRQLLVPMRIAEYALPQGTRVVPCPYLAHRRSDSFFEPQRFLPQRFFESSQDSAGKKQSAIYFPFGGGLRRCAGAELGLYEMKKMILGMMLSRLQLVRAPFFKQLRPAWRFFSLAPQSGLPVVLLHRAARSTCAAPVPV